MSKLEYNDFNIDKKVKNRLEKVQLDLTNIKNKCNNLNIPYDFKYQYYLNNMNYELGNLINKIGEIENWLEKSEKRINDDANIFEEKLVKIDFVKISQKLESINDNYV